MDQEREGGRLVTSMGELDADPLLDEYWLRGESLDDES